LKRRKKFGVGCQREGFGNKSQKGGKKGGGPPRELKLGGKKRLKGRWLRQRK